MSKIKYLFITLSLFLVTPVLAEDEYGLNTTANTAKIPTTGSLAGKIGTVVGGLLSLIGVLFFLLMVYGGVLWMTAKGDEAQAKKAQMIIVDAVVGMVVVAASYIITGFIFKAIG